MRQADVGWVRALKPSNARLESSSAGPAGLNRDLGFRVVQ